uniref:Uncharacterized protein n=1 Tax=Timema douglasi TaxID=61478 RepID=A0A7R8ZCY3_TIMDO|nr:unnamed protein product [Timema douglasi]
MHESLRDEHSKRCVDFDAQKIQMPKEEDKILKFRHMLKIPYSEIDIPIKSEEHFKEEFHDYQEPECSPGPITFPPIKEELPVKTPRKVDIIKSTRTMRDLSNYKQRFSIRLNYK